MKYILLISAFLVSGCASLTSWVPSFWDDNQSNYIIETRLDIERIDCSQPQRPQVLRVQEDLRKFELYSEAKGSLQKDVLRVIEPLQATVKEWADRGEGSRMYCQLKKDILKQQGERASKVILGRW